MENAMRIKFTAGFSLLLFIALASNALAVCTTTCYNNREGDWCYTAKKGVATIVHYMGVGGEITVPATLGGNIVDTIGSQAFKGCSVIEKVIVQEGVLSINREAFADMTNTMFIVLPDSLINIYESAFRNNTVNTITFGSGLTTVWNRAFCPVPNLQKIYFTSPAPPKWAPASAFCSAYVIDVCVPPGSEANFNLGVGFVVSACEPECAVDTDCTPPQECVYATCQDPTLIELGSFDATWKDSGVAVSWVTETELDNAYFNLYRAESIKTARKKGFKKNSKKGLMMGPYEKINADPIPALGESPGGASYEYIDTDVQTGKRYWYKLEDVDLYETATQHGPCGPVSAWEDCLYMP
jgi:hypothetical protein